MFQMERSVPGGHRTVDHSIRAASVAIAAGSTPGPFRQPCYSPPPTHPPNGRKPLDAMPLLLLYRFATTALSPLARPLLLSRARLGKEDPARLA